ncbi:hypothetical protein HQ447_05615 [bacterium]|nr:hypothetical protein [bacterium]
MPAETGAATLRYTNVVPCPPAMLGQWRDELETRFSLTFEILDRDYLEKIRRARGFGVNP